MRIGVISDLHMFNTKIYYDAFKKILPSLNLDLFLIGGDIGENADVTIEFVKFLNTIVETKYVIGNHDLWNKYTDLSHLEIIEKFRSDDNCLFNRTLVYKNLTIIGSTSWYDYSYGDHNKFTLEEFTNKSYNSRTWQDKNYANVKDDITKTKNDNHFIRQELEKAKGDVLLLTHVINNPRLLVPIEYGDWAYFNAFLGNEELYELIQEFKVKFAVCGHIHNRTSFYEGETRYICPCLGNKKEYKYFLPTVDLEENIKDALEIIIYP